MKVSEEKKIIVEKESATKKKEKKEIKTPKEEGAKIEKIQPIKLPDIKRDVPDTASYILLLADKLETYVEKPESIEKKLIEKAKEKRNIKLAEILQKRTNPRYREWITNQEKKYTRDIFFRFKETIDGYTGLTLAKEVLKEIESVFSIVEDIIELNKTYAFVFAEKKRDEFLEIRGSFRWCYNRIFDRTGEFKSKSADSFLAMLKNTRVRVHSNLRYFNLKNSDTNQILPSKIKSDYLNLSLISKNTFISDIYQDIQDFLTNLEPSSLMNTLKYISSKKEEKTNIQFFFAFYENLKAETKFAFVKNVIERSSTEDKIKYCKTIIPILSKEDVKQIEPLIKKEK